jgi:hypothetical protein
LAPFAFAILIGRGSACIPEASVGAPVIGALRPRHGLVLLQGDLAEVLAVDLDARQAPLRAAADR